MLRKNSTVDTCCFSTNIHETPKIFAEAILGEYKSTTNNKIHQVIVENISVNEKICYWRLTLDKGRTCDLLVRIRIESQGNDEIKITVQSVDEEGEAGLEKE